MALILVDFGFLRNTEFTETTHHCTVQNDQSNNRKMATRNYQTEVYLYKYGLRESETVGIRNTVLRLLLSNICDNVSGIQAQHGMVSTDVHLVLDESGRGQNIGSRRGG